MSDPSQNQIGEGQTALPIVVAEWPKKSRETLRPQISEYKGQRVIDCRAWYADSAGTKKPERGGLTVSVRHLPQLAKALCDALNAAKARGMLESGDA